MIHIIDLQFQGIESTIAAFLVETTDGPFIVETGPHSCLPRLTAGLSDLGYLLQDIKHVLLTHIHLDHAGAAWALAKTGAKVYVHPRGIKHLAAPERLWSSAKMIYGDHMERLWGAMQPIPEDQLKAVEDGEEIQIGEVILRAMHSPGHAVHHIAWQLGDTMFTGDVAGVKIGIKGPVVPPCPPPDINLEDWKDSIQRIKDLSPDHLLLTHYGQVDDVADHLNMLEKRLDAWANWIKPYFKSGTPPEEIVPKFEGYVREDLSKHGLSRRGLEQYEAANPSWMSVSGLLRYWKKHGAKRQG